MRQLLCLILLCFSFSTFSSNFIKAPTDCFSGPFESYDKWLKVLTQKKKNFKAAQFKKRFSKENFNNKKQALECRDFTYSVDDLEVEGFYLKPKIMPTTKSKKLPIVIFNRGGNARFGYVVFGKKLLFPADLAQQGYLVIGSQYRGSSKKRIANNGKDEFGGADINDVTALIELAKQIPDADLNNISLVGWSRGAMQSFVASQSLPQVKSIVAIAGNADAEKALSWRPEMEKVYKKRIPNFKQNRKNELTKRSVIKWVDKLPKNSPVLLLHGDKDKRVNVEQSIALAEKLESESHPHKLVVYKGDGHSLRKNRAAMVAEIDAWLSAHM